MIADEAVGGNDVVILTKGRFHKPAWRRRQLLGDKVTVPSLFVAQATVPAVSLPACRPAACGQQVLPIKDTLTSASPVLRAASVCVVDVSSDCAVVPRLTG